MTLSGLAYNSVQLTVGPMYLRQAAEAGKRPERASEGTETSNYSKAELDDAAKCLYVDAMETRPFWDWEVALDVGLGWERECRRFQDLFKLWQPEARVDVPGNDSQRRNRMLSRGEQGSEQCLPIGSFWGRGRKPDVMHPRWWLRQALPSGPATSLCDCAISSGVWRQS